MKSSEKAPYYLEELAEVRLGLTMRSRDSLTQDETAGPLLLRIGDVTELGRLVVRQPQRIIVSDSIRERYLVRAGDIVIANRGNRMTAAMIPDGMEAIASGQLFSVRLRSSKVAKEYMHWYLNLQRTQDFLMGRARGSSVRTLSVEVLKAELPIPVPELALQEKIVELGALAARESAIVKRIDQLRQKHLEAFLLNLANERMLKQS